ncbi:MAG: LytR C-terminal domain-containing protein [Candidatus Levybacteria bacterium]|nr:LytR C-terminal domain-containing protein [Candidatus Levybacteria bacterium]
MRAKKKEKPKSLNLALYFGFFVFLIVAASFIFKVIEEIGKSKFDGDNRFTVAVLGEDGANIISISPKDNSLTRVHVLGTVSPATLRNLSIPIYSYVKPESEISGSAKLYFVKMLFNKRSLETDLGIFDLLKLSFYSLRTPQEKLKEEVLSVEEIDQYFLSSSLFVDDRISSEKVKIQITNATNVSGLGNKIAKILTNMGANVVLVNSSKETESKSKIIYREESYSLEKTSQILGISTQKGETGSISDIIIIVGEDKEDF